MWEIWKRHKKKVYFTIGVLGSGYLLYKLYDAHKRRLSDLERELAQERENDELIKAQMQAHFGNIQRIVDTATLPHSMLYLSSRVAEELDLLHLTEQLIRGKGQSNSLSSSEKLELWEKLKILSFTRMVLSLWAMTMLSLYIRVQVNILGRHLYIDTARDLGSSHLLDEADLIDRNDQQQFLASADFLSNYGMPTLISNMQAAASEVLQGKQLKDLFNTTVLHETTVQILDMFMSMGSPHHWVDYLMPEDPNFYKLVAFSNSDSTDPSDSTKFDRLMVETRAVLSSAEFGNMVDVSLNTAVDAQKPYKTLAMAVNGTPETLQVHRLPLSKYIDALRWLPPLSAFDRFVVLAVFDSDSNSSAIEIHSLTRSNPSNLTLQSSWSSPSRISSLKVSQTLHKPLIAASTFSGSLHVLLADPVDASIESEVSVPEKTLHVGPISCIDVQENGSECVSVGEDGRVNLVSVGNSNLSHRRFFDSNGLVSYTAAKWASPMEFATGGLGFSLQWWDQRKPGGPASQFKGNWAHGTTSGIVHSIDIHPSRKHTCIAGGSSGTVFAWDLRWQQQPIVLSGVAAGEFQSHALSESEIWEVQYDSYSSNIGNMSTSRVLPVMICSEDGILAVVEQGEEPIELLAEPCAINSFDIDRQNPSDVICSLEWEAIAILMRA